MEFLCDDNSWGNKISRACVFIALLMDFPIILILYEREREILKLKLLRSNDHFVVCQNEENLIKYSIIALEHEGTYLISTIKTVYDFQTIKR